MSVSLQPMDKIAPDTSQLAENQNSANSSPSALVRIEAAALEQLAVRLEGAAGETFERVAKLLAEAAREGHRAILTGIGKSGLIARKIAATMVSTGTPACFLHPSEAVHGDLGHGGSRRCGDCALVFR